MELENRKAILGFGLAILLFVLINKTFLKKSDDDADTSNQPPVTEENIEIALTAYTNAVNDGQPQDTLNQLNSMTAADYGIRVYQRKSDGKFVVTNLAGDEVKVV